MEYRNRSSTPRNGEGRCYTICSFDRGLVVPKVQLIDAITDDEAVAKARASEICSVREVWDSHRLVAVIEPRSLETAGP